MIVCFKDKKIKVNKKYNIYDNYYTFNAVNNKNEIMATLTFKIDKRYNSRIWLNKISVIDKFAHLGASTALIYALEDFAFKHRINYIEGKFYPENKFAKPFYEKLGYEIYKDDYETFVGKYLQKQNENIKIIDTEEDNLCNF